jgi:hypothetical protein
LDLENLDHSFYSVANSLMMAKGLKVRHSL